MPVDKSDSTLQVAFAEPLNPARADELGFIVKKRDVSRSLPIRPRSGRPLTDTMARKARNVSDILKELGSDTDIAQEVEHEYQPRMMKA